MSVFIQKIIFAKSKIWAGEVLEMLLIWHGMTQYVLQITPFPYNTSYNDCVLKQVTTKCIKIILDDFGISFNI